MLGLPDRDCFAAMCAAANRTADEAALADGATRLQVLRHVILPLVRPGLAAAAVICLLYTWNEFLYALILTGRDAKTAPVAIVGFMTNKEIYWGRIAAAGMVVLVPVLAFGIIAHRHFYAEQGVVTVICNSRLPLDSGL